MPIKFFEEKSYHERIAEWFSNAPFYLQRDLVIQETDPIYRLKRVVAMMVSTIGLTLKPSKPFLPIIGETYEAFMCMDPKEVYQNIQSTTSREEYNPDIFRVYSE